MDFLNPISLFFSLSLAAMNLYQMDDSMAENLSARYSIESAVEGIHMDRCPQLIDIEISATEQDGSFFLKRMSHFQNLEPQPRVLFVDGLARMLYDGEIIKASVLDDRSLQIEIFNETLPNEKIVETMTFNNDGSLIYSAKLVDENIAGSEEICPDASYQKN